MERLASASRGRDLAKKTSMSSFFSTTSRARARASNASSTAPALQLIPINLLDVAFQTDSPFDRPASALSRSSRFESEIDLNLRTTTTGNASRVSPDVTAATSSALVASESRRGDATTLSPSQAAELIKECSLVIRARGLSTLGLFRPFRAAESLATIDQLSSLFLLHIDDSSSSTGGSNESVGLPWEEGRGSSLERFRELLSVTSIANVCSVLKWGISHLSFAPTSFGSSSLSSYPPPDLSATFSWLQPASLTARSIDTILSSLPAASRHILEETLLLVEAIVAQTDSNAMTAGKLSKLLGYWIFGVSSLVQSDHSIKYELWSRAGEAMLSCLQLYLRSQLQHARLPTRLQEVIDGVSVDRRTTRVLHIELVTEGAVEDVMKRSSMELLDLTIKMGLKDRHTMMSALLDDSSEEACDIWERVLDQICDVRAETSEKESRRIVLSEETNRILDSLKAENERLRLLANPAVVSDPAPKPKPAPTPTLTPSWSNFANLGFDSNPSEADELGFLTTLSSPATTASQSLTSSPTIISSRPPSRAAASLSSLGRLTSSIRRSTYGSRSRTSEMSQSRSLVKERVKREVGRTTMSLVEITEVDVDFVDFWLESLAAPRSSPTDLLSAIDDALSKAINQDCSSNGKDGAHRIDHIYITERIGKQIFPTTSALSSPSTSTRQPFPSASRSSAATSASRRSSRPELDLLSSSTATSKRLAASSSLPQSRYPSPSPSSGATDIFSSAASFLTLQAPPTTAIPSTRPPSTSERIAVAPARVPLAVSSVNMQSIKMNAPIETSKVKERKGLFSWLKSSKDKATAIEPSKVARVTERTLTAIDLIVVGEDQLESAKVESPKVSMSITRVKPPAFLAADILALETIALPLQMQLLDKAVVDTEPKGLGMLESMKAVEEEERSSNDVVASASSTTIIASRSSIGPTVNPPHIIVESSDDAKASSGQLPRSRRFSHEGSWRDVPILRRLSKRASTGTFVAGRGLDNAAARVSMSTAATTSQPPSPTVLISPVFESTSRTPPPSSPISSTFLFATSFATPASHGSSHVRGMDDSSSEVELVSSEYSDRTSKSESFAASDDVDEEYDERSLYDNDGNLIDPSIDSDPFAATHPSETSIYVAPSPSSRSLSRSLAHSTSRLSLARFSPTHSHPPVTIARRSSHPLSSPSSFSEAAALSRSHSARSSRSISHNYDASAISDAALPASSSASFTARSTSKKPPAASPSASTSNPPLSQVQIQRAKFSVSALIARTKSSISPKIVRSVKTRVGEIEAVKAAESSEERAFSAAGLTKTSSRIVLLATTTPMATPPTIPVALDSQFLVEPGEVLSSGEGRKSERVSSLQD